MKSRATVAARQEHTRATTTNWWCGDGVGGGGWGNGSVGDITISCAWQCLTVWSPPILFGSGCHVFVVSLLSILLRLEPCLRALRSFRCYRKTGFSQLHQLRFAELVNSDSPCPSSKQPPQYDGAAEVPLTATVACGGWHLRSTNDCGLLGIQDLLTPVNRKSLHKGLSTALTSCIILMRINPADLNM